MTNLNATKNNIKTDKKTLSALVPVCNQFSKKVKYFNNKPAIICNDKIITYLELDKYSNQLANKYYKHVTSPNPLFAIYLDRTIELFASMIAIHKIGAAYLPIDSSHPTIRIQNILKDSRPLILITTSKLVKNIVIGNSTILFLLDKQEEEIAATSTEISHEIPAEGCIDNIAFVTYTSGTTGKPKGVLNTQRGLSNLLEWYQDAIGLSPEDRLLHTFSVGFDAAQISFWWPLLQGACLVMTNTYQFCEINYLIELIKKQNITVLQSSTSLISTILDEESIAQSEQLATKVIIGGESAQPAVIKKSRKSANRRLFNVYGPTECTAIVSGIEITNIDVNEPIPIGRAVNNIELVVLDENYQPVKGDEPGELAVSGIGLAKGYLNQPELTEKKFIYIAINNQHSRFYLTGDRVQYGKDNLLYYLGRIDNQIKINGYRIELEEIEIALLNIDYIKNACIKVYDYLPDKKIAAYYVLEKEYVQIYNIKEKIINDLSKLLPSPMIPSFLIAIDEMPLNINGKIDKEKLNLPIIEKKSLVPPRSEIEKILLEFWQKILNRETIGVHDNFFDIGGDSIKIATLQTLTNDALNLKLALVAFFQFPTISKLAQHLRQQEKLTINSSNALLINKNNSEKRKSTFQRFKKHHLDKESP